MFVDNICTQFVTPTLLDKEAFTIFGLHAKPNTVSPLGHFGTGIKYAIAVLTRMDIPLRFHVGTTTYSFYSKPSGFRGTSIDEIKCKVTAPGKKSTYFKLPFTTSLGKNWSLWQAYRELESNTRDEGGYTDVVDVQTSSPEEGKTIIEVEGNDFASIHHNDEIFLPDGSSSNSLTSDSDDVELINRPSQYLYYRGVRILDLNENNYASDRDADPIRSMYTYNILKPIELTEDRTAKYAFMTVAEVGRFVASKVTDTDILKNIVTSNNPKTWESNLDFNNPGVIPTSEFLEMLIKYKQQINNKRLNEWHDNYLTIHSPPEEPKEFEALSKDELISKLESIQFNINNSYAVNNDDVLHVCTEAIRHLENMQSEEE